jgi:hypothetical protein
MMQSSVKAMNRIEGFRYLQETFTRISKAKIKAGFIVCPQIKKLTSDRNFDEVLKGTENIA